MELKLILIVVYIVLDIANAAVIEPIIQIDQGQLKGKIGESRGGKSFAEYLGIPYCQKPERFHEGILPAPKWEGLRDATKFGQVCPQFDRKLKSVIGNEDCLFCNVYTPEISTPEKSKGTPATKVLKKRPVLFHIHGGSFVSQSGNLFGPKYLLDEDVVLVTFNYRLSVFGFLSTGDNETIANLGLRDQIQMLKWVHQNIEKFGGDPTKVTLLGSGSAGGALASYLMMSPLAKGLFSSVISTSGTAICPWAVVHKPAKIVQKLAAKLNCPSSAKSSKDIVACIKGKSIKDIEIARVALQGFVEDPAVPFAPVVESWLVKDPASAPVIPDVPEKLMNDGKYNRVAWLTGVNSHNGINLGLATILTTPKRLTQLDQEWSKLAPLTFHYSQTASHPSNVSASIREHYFGKKNISLETKDKLITALTDRNFIYCTAQAASLQSKFSPVYLYHLGYVGGHSFLDEWNVRKDLNVTGVVHGDELQYFFNLDMGNFPIIKKGDKHFPFSEKIVKLWTSFAQTGKPMDIRADKTAAEWSPVPSGTGKHAVQFYSLDSAELSRPITLDGTVQSTIWDEVDLGGYKATTSSKFAIGYEMSDNRKPSPINSGRTTSSPKPLSSPKQSQLTPRTEKPLVVPSPSIEHFEPIHVKGGTILKDEDPFSSTTTTTTKKPGFFQKLVG
ncbi:esterase E4 [Folsomia candida]|uniref:esterase E4 n=1 Tax=Folsomia candida TaxID=158441 RepID=UPI000B906ACE|nr:esterase E4 [Folsomia candida]